MEEKSRSWIPPAIAGTIAGLATGLVVGWLWPMEINDALPHSLRQDHRDDYVVMVATAYEAEGDLAMARERLVQLDPEDPAAPVVELAERLVAVGGGGNDLIRLARLAYAMDAVTPALLPYIEAAP